MRAIMPAVETSNAMQPQNKETIQTLNAIAFKNGEFHEVVTARFYMARSSQASVVYCCIWAHGNGKWYTGKGSAGGYGYHKSSAALQDAIDSAGIKLVGSPYHGPAAYYEETERDAEGNYKRVKVKQDFKKTCNIGGCGDTAMYDAIKAICLALGFKKVHLVRG